MSGSRRLADLQRAMQLLRQVGESDLDFAPDPDVSADFRELTGGQAYPVESHRAKRRYHRWCSAFPALLREPKPYPTP